MHKICAKGYLGWKTKQREILYTHISLLLSQNVAPQVVQKQAGHSTIKTTMDVYGHLMPSVYSSSIDELDNAIKQKPIIKKVK